MLQNNRSSNSRPGSPFKAMPMIFPVMHPAPNIKYKIKIALPILFATLLIILFLTACVSTQPPEGPNQNPTSTSGPVYRPPADSAYKPPPPKSKPGPRVKTNTFSPLTRAAGKIADQLDRIYPMAGKRFQISQNNFWEEGTKLNLPLSVPISNFLSREISKRGGITAVTPSDELPVTVMGSYYLDSRSVILTVKLRQAGMEASQDIAVAQAPLKRKKLKPEFFEVKFERVARTMARLLEENYRHAGSVAVVVAPLKPALSSQVPLALGKAFKQYMEHSLGASDVMVLGSSDAVPGSGSPARLTGSYALSNNELTLHLELGTKGKKMIASAFYKVGLDKVPGFLLASANQSVADLGEELAEGLMGSGLGPGLGPGPGGAGLPHILINPMWIACDGSRSVPAFSTKLSTGLEAALVNRGRAGVTRRFTRKVDYVLTGSYARESGSLSAVINLDRVVWQERGFSLVRERSAASALPLNFIEDSWFDKTAETTLFYLLGQIETQAMATRECSLGQKLLLKKISFKESALFSPFSNYINTIAMDYFSKSPLFAPARSVEKKLAAFRKAKSRSLTRAVAENRRGIGIVSNKKEPVPANVEPMAAIVKASFFMTGSYWPSGADAVELKLGLYTVDKTVVGTDAVNVAKGLVGDQALFELPQAENSGFIKDQNGLENQQGGSGLGFEIFTQKGKESLYFRNGEEIIFYAYAGRDAYINIFNKDAKGNIYRIFPNAFDAAGRVKSGDAVVIPDAAYGHDFSFTVQGSLGDELVFAAASDMPLPDLPGDRLAHDMVQVSLSIEAIKERFKRYSRTYGSRLAWDYFGLRTGE